MKKLINIFLCVCLLSTGVLASTGTKRIEWYYNPTCDNTRPSGAVEGHFLDEYGGFYIGPDEKSVYLTFDLGYENENVKKIIDTLKEEDVKATFFLLRHTVVNGEYLDSIVSDGHLCANHTSHHKDMTKMSDFESFKEEIESLEKDFKEKTGKDLAKFYRPPCGAFSEQNLKWAQELGYKTVFWSLAYADWDEKAQMSPDAAINKLLSRMHNGAVILLHPTSSTNAKILGEFIRTSKSQGYTFKTLDM